MKLTKSDLKNMFKECIRELIKEGVFDEVMAEGRAPARYSLPTDKASVLLGNAKNGNATTKRPSVKDAVQAEQARSRMRQAVGYGDLIEEEETSFERSRVAAKALDENLRRVVESTAQTMAHGDPQMANAYASIFADTAMNTLPGLMSGEGSGLGARREEQLQEKVNPEQLQEMAIDGDMTRWAKVAFAGRGK